MEVEFDPNTSPPSYHSEDSVGLCVWTEQCACMLIDPMSPVPSQQFLLQGVCMHVYILSLALLSLTSIFMM